MGVEGTGSEICSLKEKIKDYGIVEKEKGGRRWRLSMVFFYHLIGLVLNFVNRN